MTESLLCYFSAFLAREGLAPASIKLYLAAVRHIQVIHGFPEPRAESSLPRLKLVMSGIARNRTSTGKPSRPRLPITIDILYKIFETLSTRPPSYNDVLLWAACSMCFFGFFRAGEITIPSKATLHLAWGDVSVDSIHQPRLLKTHLKVSKCDQTGRGVDVFMGRTNNKLCPLSACLPYMAIRHTG